MKIRAMNGKAQESEKLDKLLFAEKLLVDELIAEDPRLKAACKQARLSGNLEDGIGEGTLQIYRQRLRE